MSSILRILNKSANIRVKTLKVDSEKIFIKEKAIAFHP